jgi:hypothetical protein
VEEPCVPVVKVNPRVFVPEVSNPPVAPHKPTELGNVSDPKSWVVPVPVKVQGLRSDPSNSVAVYPLSENPAKRAG